MKRPMTKNPAIQRAISVVGSRTGLADKVGVTECCITNGLNGRRNWSFEVAVDVERVTGVRAEETVPALAERIRYLRSTKPTLR